MSTTQYVLGFLFSEERNKVCLIQKNKPKWQKDFLNGVGGKIEDSDAEYVEAMVREFKEEAGVDLHKNQWEQFSRLISIEKDFDVLVYRAFSDKIFDVSSKTDEKVGIYEVTEITELKVLDNVPWLVYMALDTSFTESKIYY